MPQRPSTRNAFSLLLLAALLAVLWRVLPSPPLPQAPDTPWPPGTRFDALLADMDDDPAQQQLRQRLQACTKQPARPHPLAIGHRGAPLRFPEHSRESYIAAAALGAGRIECDVWFTADGELVCRHSACDLHSTTNILLTPLAAKCASPFSPALLAPGSDRALRKAGASCCSADLSLSEFKSLRAGRYRANPAAHSVAEYLHIEPLSGDQPFSDHGGLLSHADSIALLQSLGVAMVPELKAGPGSVGLPDSLRGKRLSQRLIGEYRDAGVPPEQVFLQSFDLDVVLGWIRDYPDFGRQAMWLDGRYRDPEFDHRDPASWSPGMQELAAMGITTLAPPLWVLLDLDLFGNIIPSRYTIEARAAGLSLVTWTLERSGSLRSANGRGGGWYYQSVNGLNGWRPGVIYTDGDQIVVLDALVREAGVSGIFSDWPELPSRYGNCLLPNQSPILPTTHFEQADIDGKDSGS